VSNERGPILDTGAHDIHPNGRATAARAGASVGAVTEVDAVVVSYNSRDELRACVEPLVALPWTNVVVVDNASPEPSLEVVADLPVTRVALTRNGGFAHGCNAGISRGSAPYVLLLNPDARIDGASLRALVDVLDEDAAVGAVGPKVLGADGELHLSQRRFARLRSTYARAFFLHRLLPRAAWTDELVHDLSAYERRGSPDWVSGACTLVRREALHRLRGLDERFFLYREDMDLCRRLRAAGYDVRYEPRSVVRHAGGASAPRTGLVHVLAESRVRYARKHSSRPGAALERLGVALEALTHVVVSQGGAAARAGHAKALAHTLRALPRDQPEG
jgi:N-acetylglucosaminyl-diphospho-decaprenol L-rhamnosyltransferase